MPTDPADDPRLAPLYYIYPRNGREDAYNKGLMDAARALIEPSRWPSGADAIEELADALMDARMDGPWWTPPSTLTYQEAMRKHASMLLDALGPVRSKLGVDNRG